MTTKQEALTQEKPPIHNWITVVYTPAKEERIEERLAEVSHLLGSTVARPDPCYPLMFTLPPERIGPSNPQIASAMECRFVILKPGANLGINLDDWKKVEEQSLTEYRKERGVLTTIAPTIPDPPQDKKFGKLKPGYRNFEEKEALELVGLTLHEDWIDEWAIAESRDVVLTACAQQKRVLIRIKEERRAA